MAGGEGAKERRRLKRLAALEAKEKAAAPQTPKSLDKNKGKHAPNSGDRKNGKYQAGLRRSSHGGQSNNKFQKNNRNVRMDNNGKNAKKGPQKPKIKKPKHLKRKLEQASNDDDKAKEIIQKEIEEFESKKKKFSTQNKTRKRQKTTPTPAVSSTRDEVENKTDVVSRLNRINSGIEAFPRNTAVESSKPAVVEDEKMIDVTETPKPKEDEVSRDSSSDDEGSDDEIAEDDIVEQKSPQIEKPDPASEQSPSSDDDDDDDDDENNNDDEDDGTSSKPSDDGSKDDSGSDDTDDSSDDDSDDEEPLQQRQRGRRRRGRQDTAKLVEEMEAVEKSKTAKSDDDAKNETSADDNGKKRYCIGRKPVTDFAIGQTHSGKVVYIKPFGVFFDIGCHSDAFCHVSRLSDDFVEKPESLFKEGEEVKNMRIVEIDRKQKRITVSLQSEARIQDERQSIEARKQRKEKRHQKSKKSTGAGQSRVSSSHDRSEHHSSFQNKATSMPKKEHEAIKVAPVTPIEKLDPSKMTPAELKRARKLARRAERRAQSGQEGEET